MTVERPIFAATVQAARRTERISISAPGDFSLLHKTVLTRGEAARENLLPYCLDFVRRRAVYVGGVDAKGAQDAPFYYLYLRRHAQRVVTAPWDAGPLSQDARAPVFLFSPGRCGSTLLSRILSAAGSPNVSEPDFYTQATSSLAASAFNPFRAAIRDAAANMGADLAAALDSAQAPVVKLRAESCRTPQMLLQPRERRTIFMTRGFEDWARSSIRAFRSGPRKTVGKYLDAVICHAQLKRHGDCHVIRYEDLQAQPLPTMAALAGFLGRAVAPDVVLSTMKEDSQEGTPLAQGARSGGAAFEKRFEDAMALWNSDRLKRVRDRFGAEDFRTG